MVENSAIAYARGARARSTTTDRDAVPGKAATKPNARARTIEPTESLSQSALKAAVKSIGRLECSATPAAFGYDSVCTQAPPARQRAANTRKSRAATGLATLISEPRPLLAPVAWLRTGARRKIVQCRECPGLEIAPAPRCGMRRSGHER